MSDPTPPPFEGFDTPFFTQVPNALFDRLLERGTLTEAELRVLLYIMRRTFGFGKTTDAISLSQLTDGIVTSDGRRLDYGAGVRRDAASRAVQGLERKGCITITRSSSAHGGAAPNVYALRFRSRLQSSHQTTLVIPSDQGGLMGPPTLDSPADSQKIVQNKEEQEEDTGPSLAAVLSAHGGAWATQQARAQALRAARGWTPAQLAEHLTARREVGLRAKLAALEKM